MKKRIPEEHLAAFRTMCKQNSWNPVEVLTFLLEYAVDENEKLALPLHIRRVKRARGEKWQNPFKSQD